MISDGPCPGSRRGSVSEKEVSGVVLGTVGS